MKKTIIIFLAILFLSTSSLTYASLGFFKPDSKLYFLQPVLESARLFFTFSKESKTDYLIKLTDRRTEEMEINPSTQIVNLYTEHFAKLEKIAEGTLKDNNKEQIADKIKDANLHQQEILVKIYNKVPEQAQEAILNAQENSSKNVENIIESVEGSQKAQDYVQQVAQIQQARQIEQAPMEGSPNANPDDFQPKELNELNPLNQLNPINPSSNNENNGGSGQMQPVQPIQMNQPKIQN